MNETTVTVVGNIASDVSSRRVGTEGQFVVSFRVASSQRRWDRASESWVDGDRFSARVSCWRGLGEGVLTSLVKGDPVVVTGRLSVREYEVDGDRRYSTEIAASSVGPDLAWSSAHVTRRRQPTAESAAGGDATEATGSGVDGLAEPAEPVGAAVSGSGPGGVAGLHIEPAREPDEQVEALAATA